MKAQNVPDRVHLVGIGGAHMSGIAQILHAWDHVVSGSDQKTSPMTEKLRTLGMRVYEGHAAEHVGDAQLVVFTSAAHGDNPEIEEAKRRGIPVIKRDEMVARLMEGRYSVAVAGTHGKTTTSGLIARLTAWCPGATRPAGGSATADPPRAARGRPARLRGPQRPGARRPTGTPARRRRRSTGA